MTAPSIKVWDEGKRQYGSNGSVGGGPGFPQPDARKPRPNAMRREVGMVGRSKPSAVYSYQGGNVKRNCHL